MKSLLYLGRLAWASPWTLVGICGGLLALATGGACRRRDGILEFSGGALRWLLERVPPRPIALTLGHCVWGRTTAALDAAHTHELVHVRQYERFGPLMVPAYFACSLWAWLCGRDPYRDNVFEQEAFRKA